MAGTLPVVPFVPEVGQACLRALKIELVDPDSAKITLHDVVVRLPSGTDMYGGTVNAKNRMGGYNGLSSWHCRVDGGKVSSVVVR